MKRKLFYTGMTAILALGVLMMVLLFSPGVLQWSFARLAAALPGELTVQQLDGRLAGPIHFQQLRYLSDEADLRITQGEFNWKPSRLLAGVLHLGRVRLAGLAYRPIQAGSSPDVPASDATPLPTLAVPLEVVLDQLDVTEMEMGADSPTNLQRIELRKARLVGSRLRFERIEIAAADWQIGGGGRLRLAEDYPLALRFDWHYRLRPPALLRGAGRVEGNLIRMQIRQQFEGMMTGRFEARLDNVLHDLQWQAKANLNRFDLAALDASLPQGGITGSLQGQGSVARFQIDSELEVQLPDTDEMHAHIGLQAEDGLYRLVDSTVHHVASGGRLQLEGSWDSRMASTKPRLALQGNWQKLQWPLSNPQFYSQDGKFGLAGNLNQYRFTVDAQLEGSELPSSRLAAKGNGNSQKLRIADYRMTTLDGQIEGEGDLTWQPTLQTELNIRFDKLNPGRKWPQWPGRLNGRLRLSSRSLQEHLRLDFDTIEGHLRDLPLTIAGQAERDADGWKLQLPDVRFGSARLHLAGRLGEHSDLQWRLQIPELAGMLPDARGRLDSEGRVQGPRSKPAIKAELKGENLRYRIYGLGQVQGHFELEQAGAGRLALQLTASDLQFEQRKWDLLELTGDGNLQQHVLQLQGHNAGDRLALQLQGHLDGNGGWVASLTQGQFHLSPYGDWKLETPQAIQIHEQKLRLERTCWVSTPGRICLAGSREGDDHTAQIDLKQFPVAWLQGGVPEGLAFGGWLDGTFDYRRQSGQEQGRAHLQWHQGQMHYQTSEGRHSLGFQDSLLEAELDAQGLAATLNVPLGNQEHMTAHVRLPGWSPTQPAVANQTLQGDLQLALRSIQILETVLPEVKQLQGTVAADLQLAGTLGAPSVTGTLHLKQARADLPLLGIRLQDMDVRVHSDGGQSLDYAARLRSGDGQLEVIGTTRLSAQDNWPSQLSVKGNNFRVVDLPEAVVDVSPRLEVESQQQVLTLRGELEVPRARIRPVSLPPSAVAVSDDVVIISREKVEDLRASAANPGWQFHTRVKLLSGPDVQFEGFGLRGRIQGQLDLSEDPDRPLTASGKLAILDGTYKAYGQDLSIERGQLFYADNPLDEPALDVRAVRKVGEVTAGINVTQTLQQPVVTLFSEPPLNETQILSYLVLGRPLHAASESEGLSLMSAATALGLAQGESLARKIGAQFGFEEVSIEAGNGFNQPALVVGKYLSPRLYMRYISGLFEQGSFVQLQYRVSKKLLLQTETGSRSGVDLFYTFKRN